MEDLEARIRTDVERLCGPGDRALGTARNRTATDYVMRRLAGAGLEVEPIEFAVPEWRYDTARVSADGLELTVHPGPFSPAATGEGPLVVIQSLDGIRAVTTPGAVLLLTGEIAATQFAPRNYPFYTDAGHTAIVDALEAAQPLAVLAATGSSAMTGAMCPFPLIEEAEFAVPSAYMTEGEGAALENHAGESVWISIESEVLPSSSVQPVARRSGSGGRIIVSAHVDSKPDTPGAIDNAAGVAVMLAAADLLRNVPLSRAVEFVPFNGEDHALAPGEMAWLAVDDLGSVALNVNVDAPGLRGGPSAYSLYGVDERTRETAARLASDAATVVEGPEWYASDHMVFVMRGIPAVAITSNDFKTASRGYSHTPADVPDILDYRLLSELSRFIADLIRQLD